MSTPQTEAMGLATAIGGTHEHQRRGIQSATEAVQDVLDAWHHDSDRPDVYDALCLARAALAEAGDRLSVPDTALIGKGQRAWWPEGRKERP